jgi:cell division inhibitor SepF
MSQPPKGLTALLVVATAATLAVGAPSRGDAERTGGSPNTPSDLQEEYPLRDQKECCSAPPTPSAATPKAPLPGPDGGEGGGVPVWPLLLIALSGSIVLAFLLGAFGRFDRSRLAARAAAVPRAVRRIDVSPITAAATAVPRAIRRIDLSATMRRRDRSGDADRQAHGRDREARERRRTTGLRALRVRRNRSRHAEVAARPSEPSGIMERIDQSKDEPEVPRGEDRPTGEQGPRPPRVARVPDGPIHVVAPHTFGEAEEIAGGFEHSVPVILDLRTTERRLADRLIDFASGLAFGLGGTMEEIAEDLLLILPPDVRISAEQAARLRDPRSFQP